MPLPLRYKTSDEGNVNRRTSIRVRTPLLAQWILLWYWVGVSGYILLFDPQFLYNYGIEGIRLSHFILRSLGPIIAESVKNQSPKKRFLFKNSVSTKNQSKSKLCYTKSGEINMSLCMSYFGNTEFLGYTSNLWYLYFIQL